MLTALNSLVTVIDRPRKARWTLHGLHVPLTPFDEALTLVYRVLFLLFAESRELVPSRHPIYARGYALGSLCRDAMAADRVPGLWEGLAAVTRLSRAGVNTGDLIVRPFNGRLFARAAAPSLEPVRAPAKPTAGAIRRDAALQRALVALGSRAAPAGRQEISYADLGVEQLGAVYERVLDFEPSAPLATRSKARHSLQRKQSGTFYTPQALADFVVRRTLAPLVAGATADQILSLRVVDPAMGSGAFLVSACTFLAGAYERALVEEGRRTADEFDERERAQIRRRIAERCLAGVDANPVAVQLARLSLWLTTLAGGKPLGFLDHRLRTGNSLAGAFPEDLSRTTGRRGLAHSPALPLFDDELARSIGRLAIPLGELAARSDDTVDDVRAKEAAWLRVSGDQSPLAPWRLACHLWCARWFSASDRLSPAELRAAVDAVLKNDRTLGHERIAKWLAEAAAVARERSFLHWPLEFTDVFYESDGTPRREPGFDAVIGNPPWEMLREDPSGAHASLARFLRDSGLYPESSRGHLNLYQPFLERALQITRASGRIGLVLPWSFATDDGAAALRGRLIDHGRLDTVVGVDNAGGIFPVHRGLRFLVLVAGAAGRTADTRGRFGVKTAAELDNLPGRDDPLRTSYPVRLAPRRLAIIGGMTRRIPDLRRDGDLALLEHLAGAHPRLGSAEGWRLQFGRELNATEDRRHFGVTGMPVVEGKQIAPFVVDARAADARLDEARAVRLLPDRPFEYPRLAYRDVSAATNKLSFIAAIIPSGVVTTHSLFCVKRRLAPMQQHFLCGLFNSFVLNAVVRLLMGSHVTTSLVEGLPVPVWRASREQRRIAHLAAKLGGAGRETGGGAGLQTGSNPRIYAALQAAVARLYALDVDTFAHVLDGFPLVPRTDRDLARAMLQSYTTAARPRPTRNAPTT